MTSLILSLLLITAVVNDSHSHRIPNLLTGSGLLAGLVLSVASPLDNIGLLNALYGAGLGFLLLLPGYALGKMGAGDVKLMTMAGSFLGPYSVIDAGALTLIAGGVLALLWLALQRLIPGESVQSAHSAAASCEFAGKSGSVWKQRFPYALAIAVGCFAVLFSSFSLFPVGAD